MSDASNTSSAMDLGDPDSDEDLQEKAQVALEKRAIDKIGAALQVLAGQTAQEIMDKPDAVEATGGYIKLWHEAYEKYQATHETSFLAARFGYAVEVLFGKKIKEDAGGIRKQLDAMKWTIQSQVTHGGTRVDFELKRKDGSSVYWFDLTSDSQKGHIYDKASTKYRDEEKAREITYPSLDTTELAASGGASISDRVSRRSKAKSSAQAEEREWAELVRRLKSAIEKIAVPEKILNNRTELRAFIETELYELIEGPLAEMSGFHNGKKLNPSVANSLLSEVGISVRAFGYGPGSATNAPGARQIMQQLIDDAW